MNGGPPFILFNRISRSLMSSGWAKEDRSSRSTKGNCKGCADENLRAQCERYRRRDLPN